MDPSSGHFWCVKCKQGFPTQDELTLHKKVHERMYRYRCPYCDKGFSSSSNRRGHLAKHTLKKEYACTLCGYEYVYRKNLVYHMRRHHDKDFSWLGWLKVTIIIRCRVEHVAFQTWVDVLATTPTTLVGTAVAQVFCGTSLIKQRTFKTDVVDYDVVYCWHCHEDVDLKTMCEMWC